MKKHLSILIPAYNEKERLPSTLDSYLKFLEERTNYDYEIIVIDDGSSDGTAEEVKKLSLPKVKVVVLEKNMGKGAAVKAGVINSQGEMVLICDADGSTPISELPKLTHELKSGIDLAIGSRNNQELIGEKQPPFRVFLGKFFNKLVRILLKANIKDTQCGFKLMKGDLARSVFSEMKINGFCFDVELLYLAMQRKSQVKEIPVIWINDERSKVNVITDPIKMFIDLFRIKLIHSAI
ncbi:MAG: glycosyltransferase family 2 protein [Candidatus Caenarcaniphilales bacterium]|nr:glycosyltransferase family 2 protein [Candidatus Caenarcaniphilales bacterium]